MSDSPVIIRNQELHPAEDYAKLREAGIKLIEDLGHELWTDYNLHDPGITIMEAFCFMLTDLGYRTNHVMKDLLTREVEGVPESVGKFHTAREIFSCNPITFDDLRKLLVDIRGVRNAWIKKHKDIGYYLDSCGPELAVRPTESDTTNSTREEAEEEEKRWVKLPALNGLFEVLLEYEEYVRELKVGIDNNACVKGGYLPPQGRGIEFEIYSDLVIREVSIYPKSLAPVEIELLDATGKVVDCYRFHPKQTHRKQYVTLNFGLIYDRSTKNTYRLVATGDTPLLYAHKEAAFVNSEGFLLDGYLKLLHGAGADGAEVDGGIYYFFYDWEIELPAYLGATHITKRFHTGLPDSLDSAGKPIDPERQAIVFDAISPIKLESVCIYAVGKGIIEIVLYDEFDQVVTYLDEEGKVQEFRETQNINVDRRGKNDKTIEVVLNWDVPACQGYRLRAHCLDGRVQLFMNEEGGFPYTDSGVISLLGGTITDELTQNYYFFYDWIISYEQKILPDLPDEELTSGHVKSEVRERLRTHRNLCEETVRIKPIETEEIGLYADIEFEGEKAEEIMAEVYCRMEEYVKPAIRFYTWQQLMDKGLPSDEAFSGPLLEHGFIDPVEFEKTDRRKDLRASDVVQLLMDIPGVKLVKNLYLTSFIDGRLAKKESWILCLDTSDCLAPNFSPSRSGISLLRNGIPYQCNPDRLAELLEEKRLHNRSVKLKDHQLDCEIPIGEDMEVEDFYPLQNDLPITYLVGQNRLPDSSPAQRRAQSNQLKAFLLFFEQILANYLSQLENLPALFSWELPQVRDEIQTYFTQEIKEIADLHVIYQDIDALPQNLLEIIEKEEEARDRKNAFLDHLLGRFAEDFSSYATLMYSLFNNRKEAGLRLIEDKALFFEHYPDVSRNRAVGLDFAQIKGMPQLSGYQRRIYRKLGMYQRFPTSLDQAPLESVWESGKGWKFYLLDQAGKTIFESVYTVSREALDNLIDIAAFAGEQTTNYIEAKETDPCWEDQGNWVLISPCKPGSTHTVLGVVLGTESDSLKTVQHLFKTLQRSATYSQPADLSYQRLASEAIAFQQQTDSNGKESWSFQVKDSAGTVIFESVSCDSEFFIEELLEEAMKVGKEWDSYQISEDGCSWELYACQGESRSLIGTSIGLFTRKSLRDQFDLLYHSEGMHLLEHILLRPRISGDPFLQVQFHSVSEEESCYSEEGDPIFVADPYSFRMSLVLPAWSHRFHNLQFRHFAEDSIRLEAPAHVYANVYWLSFRQMQEFETVYFDWYQAFGKLPDTFTGGLPLAVIDESRINEELASLLHDYNRALHKLVQTLQSLKIIYPQAQLYDQSSQQGGATQLTLGNMSLGRM